MCGIAGIFGWRGNSSSIRKSLSAMETALAHRGPDDRDIWINTDATAGLSHTRLSILDLSNAAHQPMATPSGRLEIAFNGEVYNFREIREKLEKERITFHSTSDTEVILFAYQQYGEKCLQSFDGMFAFAIYDNERKQGFLARDPFGIKPLYYHFSNGRLIFASEIRTLLATELIERKLCARAVDSFLRCGSVQEPDSIIQGIHALPAGSFLTWTDGNIAISSFASTDFSSEPDESDAVERIRDAFQKTIRRHLVSDVPVGVFLSGGIDSSCIAKAVVHTTRAQTHTFSIGVEDTALNEAPVASRFAAELGTQHYEYLLREEDIPCLFRDYLAAIDQPSIDGFNTFCVSRFARQNGAKVVLSGLGGDEIFGGYGSFSRVPRLLNISHRIHSGGIPVNAIGRMLEATFPDSKAKRAGEWLQKFPSPEASYHFVRSIFSRRQSRNLQSLLGLPNPMEWIAPSPPSFSDIRNQVSYMEINGYMRNQLLKDSDVMSMAHGLELRVPLADWEFFRVASRISPNRRFAPGKQLLVEAAGGLPEWITQQPKRGFLFPFQKWSQHLWKDRDACHSPIRINESWPWYQRWAVAVLEDWMNRNGVTA